MISTATVLSRCQRFVKSQKTDKECKAFAHKCYCRHNQELEQEQRRLEQEAEGLAQRLDAVLQDKFASSSFDSDTPIDKTLGYLQSIIKVLLVCIHIVLVVAAL